MHRAKSWREYLWLSFKGVLMGAADAVPGVSGGTIAFISGIYDELIDSLKQVNPAALSVLFKQGPVAFWRYINGAFLLTLFSGIVVSLFSVSHLVVYWLEHAPQLLWSFFFGLVLASTWLIGRDISRWNSHSSGVFIIGTLLAYVITTLTPAVLVATPLTLFLSGMLAICAMILPGISGSFILLLLGMYAPVISAIQALDLAVLGIFAGGCVLGLLSFSHLLSWLLHHHRVSTMALLAGFLLGSLNKLWPWKYTTAYTIDRHGEQLPLVQKNMWPEAFQATTGQPAYALICLGLMLLGAVLVMLLMWLDRRHRE
ncbi:DUF368 domain-containing protein [Pontibacter sp. JAM-7]|uniref:DUF368 domain-containing protein n=1 Tax=Pontibacter sp. JAM-7 TaxID=3366581 RepID=UPI003AF75124